MQRTQRILDIQAVADLLGVQRATVDKWRTRGILPESPTRAWDRFTITEWARKTGRPLAEPQLVDDRSAKSGNPGRMELVVDLPKARGGHPRWKTITHQRDGQVLCNGRRIGWVTWSCGVCDEVFVRPPLYSVFEARRGNDGPVGWFVTQRAAVRWVARLGTTAEPMTGAQAWAMNEFNVVEASALDSLIYREFEQNSGLIVQAAEHLAYAEDVCREAGIPLDVLVRRGRVVEYLAFERPYDNDLD
jgi:predicted DNA-binding transcriptional regulator AlpA